MRKKHHAEARGFGMPGAAQVRSAQGVAASSHYAERKQSICRLAAFWLAGLVLILTAAAGHAEPKRVLIVHSFGSVAPPFTTHSVAFETELVENLGERVDLDEVSLDNARYGEPDMQEALVQYLQKRQAKWQPDLVVPIGSPAGVFVAQYRDRLFANVPILYCGMDQRRLPPGTLEKNAAFIGENFDLPAFVEDILKIAPATKNIAVVIGASRLEQYWAAAFRKEWEPFANRVNFIWLNDLSLDQMLERTKTLPPSSCIFLILLLRDASGVTHNADEALQRIHAVASAPITGIFEHQLGLGILGGRLYQAEREGRDAAHTAIRILHGEPTSNFPPQIVGPLPPRYDWRELKRWKIDRNLLPFDSKIFFREPTTWERHKILIIAGGSLCVVQALLIFGLLANLFRRQRAETSLTESEERFRKMADAAPVLIWMAGPDKQCTFFNKGWLDFTGRPMQDELGDGWTEGVHADDFGSCLKTYVTAFDAREPFVMQYRLRHESGQYRSIIDNGVPRYGKNQEFRGYVGACVDITDLLEKERALHEFEERVTLAAEAARLGVWELDTTTNQLWVSDKVRDLFHFDPDVPITLEAFQDRVHPEDRALWDEAIRKAIETEGSYELEYRLLLPDGSIRWMSGRARCLSGDNGHLTRLLGVSMDVTERKQAQELFRLATEASPSGTLLVDRKGFIVLVNAHVEELFGYGRDELVGRTAEVLVPERFLADFVSHRSEYMAAPEPQVMGESWELFARRKDGSEFPTEVRLNPIPGPQGVLILISVLDLSARKAAEVEARHRREQIELLSRVSLLGEMTASLAHELNQPLSAIVSNANAGMRFIDKGKVDPADLREILSDVATDGRRAHDIIWNVRNTIKKGSAIRQAIDLNEVVRNVAHMVHADAATHHCSVKTLLAKDLPLVEGDPTQMQQLLINLVSNAFHAMRESAPDNRKVEIMTERNGDNTIHVAVRDYGSGLPADQQDRLFEQFFTTKEEGLGMGLAIVRSIVESHGGKISAENAEGGGARFSFAIPITGQT